MREFAPLGGMELFFCWCKKHLRFECGSVRIQEATEDYIEQHPEMVEAIFEAH